MGARRPPRRGRPFGGRPRPGMLGGSFQELLDQIQNRGGLGRGPSTIPPRERDMDRPGIRPPGVPDDRDIVIDDGPGMDRPGIRPPRRGGNRTAEEREKIQIRRKKERMRRREERMKRRQERNKSRREERMKRRAERRKRRAERLKDRPRRDRDPVSRRFAPGERKRRRRKLPKDMPRPISRRFAPGEEPN